MRLNNHVDGTRTIGAIHQGLVQNPELKDLLGLSLAGLLHDLDLLGGELSKLKGTYTLDTPQDALLLARLQRLSGEASLLGEDRATLRHLLDSGLPSLGKLEGHLLGLRPLLAVLGLDLELAPLELSATLDGLDQTSGLDALLNLSADRLLADLELLNDGLAGLGDDLLLPEGEGGLLLLDQLELLLPGHTLTDAQKAKLGQLLWNELSELKLLNAALLDLLPLLRSLGLGLAQEDAFSCPLR